MRPTHSLLVLAFALTVACSQAETPTDASRIVMMDAATQCASPGSRAAGFHCSCAADCVGDNITCLTEETSGDPRGLCAAPCFGGAACPTGSACGDDVCYLTCTTPADCGPDTLCITGLCLPHCDADGDCLSGHCNGYIGRCLAPGAPIPGLGLDAPCATNAECRSDVCTGGHCTTPCSVAAGLCPDDGICVRASGDVGLCLVPCSTDAPCESPDRRCAAINVDTPAACLPTSTAGCRGRLVEPSAGGVCGCDADCDDGTRCLREPTLAFPQGLCQLSCTTDAGCPATHACVGTICLPRCTSDDPCAVGRLCLAGVCYPYCVANEECLSGVCDREAGRCRPPGAGRGVDATCAAGSDCASGICDTSTHPDGQCEVACSTVRGACPDSAVCIPGRTVPTSGFCHLACTASSDCPQATARCVATGAGLPDHCE